MELIRLSIDTGLCMLIWLVQLIIYPSFIYIDRQKMNYWHSLYTRKITYFIAPLLFLQTGMIVYQILFETLYYLIDGLLLSIIWFNTFFVAIPIHKAIDRKQSRAFNILKLIKINRWRTAAWTVILLLSLWRILLK